MSAFFKFQICALSFGFCIVFCAGTIGVVICAGCVVAALTAGITAGVVGATAGAGTGAGLTGAAIARQEVATATKTKNAYRANRFPCIAQTPSKFLLRIEFSSLGDLEG